MKEKYRFDQQFAEATYDFLIEHGVSHDMAAIVKLLILMLALTIVAYVADFFARKILISAMQRFAARTQSKLDDVLLDRKAFKFLAHIVPAIIVSTSIPLVFHDFPVFIKPLKEAVDIYMIIVLVLLVQAVIRAGKDLLKERPSLKDKPIDSFGQLINILNYIVGAVLIFSELTGKTVWSFFAAMGAASAVLLLVFKDTILGFVGSIQLAINDMVRIGDWITMKKYGADGDVIEITLNTVKVRNFDNTITTIPTYALISDSFKNWRGMQESGGRRIKRSLNVKISSIKFLDNKDIERLQKYHLIEDYVLRKQKDINGFNVEKNYDKSSLINGRNLTNIGVFRKYMEEYVKFHPAINKDMTLMTRQLEPTEKGLPIEVYTFSSDKNWVNYEHIMSDIFDHLLAAIPYFDLEVFEVPAGNDFKGIADQLNQIK